MESLKALRKVKGVSQQVVADFLEITRQAYSNYENGNRAPDTETLLKLGEYFNVSIDYLLRGEEKSPPPETEDGLNVVRIAGRDGSYTEKRLTDEQIAALKTLVDQLPEADV